MENRLRFPQGGSKRYLWWRERMERILRDGPTIMASPSETGGDIVIPTMIVQPDVTNIRERLNGSTLGPTSTYGRYVVQGEKLKHLDMIIGGDWAINPNYEESRQKSRIEIFSEIDNGKQRMYTFRLNVPYDSIDGINGKLNL